MYLSKYLEKNNHVEKCITGLTWAENQSDMDCE